MKIIEKIKDFFRRIKIKKLQEPEACNEKIENTDKNETDTLDRIRNIQKSELTDKQKLEKIFKMIGCDQVSINSILENESIDIDNLRKNIQTLGKFIYSNIELSIILTNNITVLTIANEKLNSIINELINYFNNVNIVKEIIYANSKILSKNGLDKLSKVKERFETYGISVIEDYNILVENSNILFMDDVRLKESLAVIKEYTANIDKLTSLIRMEPSVVGITNTNLLSEYV